MIKTLVLYESKYKTTWEASNIISLIMGPSRCYPISKFSDDLRNFDFIVIGTPIYNGKIHPKMEVFLEKEHKWLSENKIAIFCTCFKGSEGLRVLREVEDRLGENVLELGVFGGRLEMDRLTDRDYHAFVEYLSKEGLPPQGMDLFNREEIVDWALRLKNMKDGLFGRLPLSQLRKEVENFLKNHHTCTLATGSFGRIRATPVEYIYNQGQIYILSEGGEKFANLLFSSKISMAVYEDYTDINNLLGIQITGQADIVEEMTEYKHVIKLKGMDMKFVRSLFTDLHVIRVDMEKVEFLNSDFKKQGYSTRQVLKF